ncbi:polysaccharide deacetylase family protein [Halobium palmae]|uniref:Polysaccharide deacetylase family protein n=1 Tax=Halobium palmae TaxID=1776492 RepID=A0ABD5RZK7_9EURY
MTRQTRRAALRRLGTVGLLGAGLAGSGQAAEPNVVVVSNVGRDETASYEFEVSGSVTTSSSPSGDYTDGARAWGSVHGWKDGYEFTGEITTFSHEGFVRVYVNGVEVDPATLGSSSPPSESREIVVSNVGRDESATYEFEVSGSVTASSSPSGDYTDGTRAWGRIHGWKDGYEFTGEITSFSHDGAVEVYVDGTAVDPATFGSSSPPPESREIVVSNVGRDETASYEFEVSETVTASSSPSGDYTDGTRAWGSVRGWKDGYEFTGEITTFSHEGFVRVYIDGVEVDPAALGESAGGDSGSDPDTDSTDADHLHDMDDWSDWGPYTNWSNGVVEPTASDAYAGETSLRVTSTSGRLGATYQPAEPLDLSGKRFSLAMRASLEDPQWSQRFSLYLVDSAGRRSDYGFQYPLWMMGDPDNWLRVPVFKKPNSTAEADLSSIATIRVSSWPGGAAEFALDDIRLHEQGTGRVLFTFDDGPASQQLAMDYMHEKGVPGTIFPMKSYIDRGTLSIESLREAKRRGWTVGVHPQRSDPLPEMSLDAARAAMDEESAWIDSLGFDSNVMAWPYGAFDGDTLAAAEERFDLAFSTGGTPTATEISCPLNVGRSGGNSADDDGDGIPDESKHAIDRAVEYGETAVLNYHSIGRTDSYTTPLDHFRNTIDYAIRSGVSIETAADLL